jgi:hypothetical protein
LTPRDLIWVARLHNTLCTHVSDHSCGSLVAQCLR